MTIAKLLPKHRIEAAEAGGLWPNRLITDYLDSAVARHSDNTAIVAYNCSARTTIRKSFAELERASARAALALAAMGIGSGDVVSFQLPNWWEFIALYVACTRLGAISNPLMPIYRSANCVHAGLAEAKSYSCRRFRGFNHPETMASLRPSLRISRADLLVIAGDGEKSFRRRLLNTAESRPARALAASASERHREILYTSGTTGQPKGVMHTHNTLYSLIEQYIRGST